VAATATEAKAIATMDIFWKIRGRLAASAA
jgi:hypothetical protein